MNNSPGRVFLSAMATDEALYTRVKGGDIAAFDELYARHERPLFGFLLATLKSRPDAEDVFQEAFMKALTSPEVRFDSASFRAWLFRIARNAMLNRLRNDQRREGTLVAAPEPEPARPADDGIDQLQMLEALQAAAKQLPPLLAELYQLRHSGLSYEEMAAVLEVPMGTLKSRMNRMVVLLREAMTPWIAH